MSTITALYRADLFEYAIGLEKIISDSVITTLYKHPNLKLVFQKMSCIGYKRNIIDHRLNLNLCLIAYYLDRSCYIEFDDPQIKFNSYALNASLGNEYWQYIDELNYYHLGFFHGVFRIPNHPVSPIHIEYDHQHFLSIKGQYEKC